MSILDRDLAFSFPHLRRLQKLGIEAMELADQTARSQEESMARIEGYLDELPPGIDTSELRQTLKACRGKIAIPIYQETKHFLQHRIDSLIEGISRIDRESAQEFMELAERSRQLKWQYQGIVEMIGKGAAELTNAEFQAKLNHIMEIGEDPLLRDYIKVEDGSFVYQWDQISDTMKKASLSERQLDLMVRILIEMGYEKQWQDLYREFVQVSNQSVKKDECSSNPNLELLLHGYDQTIGSNHAMRAAYEELVRMVASGRQISVMVVLDQKAYEYERIIEWIQPDYQMSKEEIATAKKILSAYWGKGTDLEHLSPDRFNSLRKAAKELSVPEFEAYQLHLLLSYKCNPWDSFWLKMADNVKIFSVLSDLSMEHDLNQYGKEYLDALQYKNAAAIAGSQHVWQSKAGGISGGVVNILMAMRAAKGIDKVTGIFGGAANQGVIGNEMLGATKVLTGFSLKELGIASLIDAGLYTLPLAVEDWKEGKSVREIAKNVSLNTVQSVGFNAAGMVAVDLAKIAASYVRDWAKPHMHDWLKWLGRNGDDVVEEAGKFELNNPIKVKTNKGIEVEFTNPSGNTIKYIEQNPKNIPNAIESAMNSSNTGKAIEGRVGSFVQQKTEVIGFGQEVLNSSGGKVTDLDVVTKSQIIEVKKSASSLKVDQIDRLIDPINPQFFNFDDKEVIIYIEESIEGITNPHTLEKIQYILEKKIKIVNSLDELEGVIK